MINITAASLKDINNMNNCRSIIVIGRGSIVSEGSRLLPGAPCW